MMSKKTFSLTILITLIALAFIVPSALAGVLGDKFKATIMLANPAGTLTTEANGMIVGDNQFAEGTTDAQPSLKVMFDKRVNLHNTAAPADTASDAEKAAYANAFAAADIKVTIFNRMTGATSSATIAVDDITTDPQDGTNNLANPWAMFTVVLPGAVAADSTVLVTIAAGAVENADPADVIKAGTGDDTLGKNDKASLQFDVLAALADTDPRTLSVMGLPGIVLGPDTHDAFSFTVTLSEKPKDFKKDHIEASNATVSGDPVFAGTMAEDSTATPPLTSTEASNLVYRYLVSVKPKYESKDDIVIKIKSFEDTSTPANKSPVSMAYRVKVNSDANKKVGQYGREVNLTNKAVVPASGYLVVADDKGKSLVTDPGNAEHGSADIARRVEAKKQTYNLVGVDLGADLEGFLIRGGTIDLISGNAGLVITEIMWATDAGGTERQWIEIANTTTSDIKFGDKTHKLKFYEANEVLPDPTVAANKIVDRVSTLYKGTNHWSIAGKGQSGRTEGKITEVLKDGTKNVAVDVEIVPTDRLISMERTMAADGTYDDGTMEGSWGQSMAPSQNFTDAAGGLFVGSPGTSPINPVADPPPDTPAATVSAAMPDEIMISEIMVDTGNGRSPQWIELTYSGMDKATLEGWEMVIDNAIDADVLGGGAAITVSLSGVMLDVSAHTGNMGKGQSVLVVAWPTMRHSANIRSARVIDVQAQLGQTRNFQLLSYNGFRITLSPPQTGAIFEPGDVAGNLHEDWELPMSEGTARSSIIRYAMLADGTMTMGTDANAWVLADGTDLAVGPQSFYGDDEDSSTPGQHAGGPLPVELSHFRPARDQQTGAVVITWSTQSELNNAGFFIKRAQQKDGEFKVINAAMIVGAGTTSEKQFYTYTDTTAQPNVVYYYQIEDVSLDGNRQTLTRGIRLKGHIGAAGKLTSTWGELKSSNE